MCKLLVGVFAGVFVGALAYEVIRKTEFTRKAGRMVSDSMRAAKQAFDEGYQRSVAVPAAASGN